MKKIYAAFFPVCLLLFTTCKKEHPADPFNDQLIGSSWELYKVDAPNYIDPPFVNGHFTFKSGGQLEYLDINNQLYKGTWYINHHEDNGMRFLNLRVLDSHNTLLAQYFDDIRFIDTGHFVAYFYTTSLVNSFYFKR